MDIHIKDQEVSREELIKTFEILYNKGLISQDELQRAIATTIQRYKTNSTNGINIK